MFKFLNPYFRLMRLHQPTGIWLLLFPCLWSIALAAASPLDRDFIRLIFIFTPGAVIMRGAGCIINDIIDRKYDAQVERTKNRPLASGELNIMQAQALLSVLLLLGLVLLLQLNLLAIKVGVFSLLLVIAYPFMKRITYWPQIFLGLTFNIGALMGWAAMKNHIGLPAVLLYIGGFFWTLGYDTIYAHQDKLDDAKAGVKSTALALKENTKTGLAIFYSATVLFIFLAQYFAIGRPIFNGLLLIAILQLFWQINNIDLNSPEDCHRKFKSNFWFGLIVFLSAVLATAF